MFTLIRNWWRRRRGEHVCDEFTRWTKREAVRMSFSPEEWGEDAVRAVNVACESGHANVFWQERQCTVCGKIQQEELEH